MHIDLEAEAVLEPSICFNHPLSEEWQTPQSIFLTGATGFLGVYLLYELLQKTSAKIYCLVRCNNYDSGFDRLQKALSFYKLWQEAFRDRIVVVMGDLSQPLFGFSQEGFERLATEVDIIYHSGAKVNIRSSYEELKATNILATQEVLRLACMAKTKPVNYISSLGVFFTPAYSKKDRILETDMADFSVLKNGYQKTKAVAEKMIAIARERGLSTCTYRPGRIMADSNTGISRNRVFFLIELLRACILLGKYPSRSTAFQIVSIDYVSQAIINLSLQEKSLGKTFHVSNPQAISWIDLMTKVSSLGYSLKEIDYQQWLRELEDYVSTQTDNELVGLVKHLKNFQYNIFSPRAYFDTSLTKEGLADTSTTCHQVDKKLLQVYFSYLIKSGYLPTA
ncbi:MAG: thioester reductase domain-containing protein [Trichodesmium sp. ALOHA_ZT_67]|nr:thioester reductase domain-containing protein [Trichodesmium sp. ALOHA_ZT_67]